MYENNVKKQIDNKKIELNKVFDKHSAYNEDIEDTRQKVKFYKSMGYDYKKIMQLVNFSNLTCNSVEDVKTKINYLTSLGFTYEEVKSIIGQDTEGRNNIR